MTGRVCIFPLNLEFVIPFPVFLHLPTLSITPPFVVDHLKCKCCLGLETRTHLYPRWAPQLTALHRLHSQPPLDIPAPHTYFTYGPLTEPIYTLSPFF